jgi:2-methylisocitrate lyase-like PEP mutase family enzyme
VNVLAGGAARELSVDQLGELGARRISLGSTLSRAAMSAVVHAARHIAEFGTFPDTSEVLSGGEVNDVLGSP